MKGKWKRDLVSAIAVAFLLGLSTVAAIVYMDESGADEFCDFVDDGAGLIPLAHVEPDIRCNREWLTIMYGSIHFGLLLFFTPLFILIHGLRWIVHLLVRLNRHLAG